jgi:multimeric flavodoxin WrbA
MKILGMSGGSKNGTNDAMCKEALMGAKEEGADVEFIHLLDLDLKPCTGCLACVIGKNGVLNGGSGACVIKDDFAWLDEKYLEADALVFAMPIYEKGVPGVFRLLEDRMAGPGHDTGLLTIAGKIAQQKGGKGPDPRHFKKRLAVYIGIGGSDWDCRMDSDMKLFGMAAPLKCINSLVFNWSKSMIGDDEKVAKVREAGRALARAAKDPEKAEYVGAPGICAHCHSTVFRLRPDAKSAECVVCGIIGEVKVTDGKLSFAFPPEQVERAHDTMSGKFHHMDDMQKIEGGFAALRETEEFKRRQAAYKACISPSKPSN